jgi:hypothetical protein
MPEGNVSGLGYDVYTSWERFNMFEDMLKKSDSLTFRI